MTQIEKEINTLYESCGIPSEAECPIIMDLNHGELNNKLHSDNDAFTKNSAFSYSACGASSVGFDWLSKNGFKFI